VQTGQATSEGAGLEFRDLVCVRGIISLLEQGVPLRRIRRNVEMLRDRLPEIDDPIRSLRVWVEGSERIVVRHDGVLLEPDGQMVLDFGDESGAGHLGAELDGEVAELGRQAAEEASAIDAAEECFVRGCSLDGEPTTYNAAIAAYLEGIELHPEFADCHCNLGAVYYNRGDKRPARRCFERCLGIDAQHVEANFNLANLLEEAGCDDMALHHYRAALAADPLYPDLHINLALLYEKLGQPERGRRHWQRYLQLDSAGAWAEVARRKLDREE
jgi:tetratricopeptide (TPR) repeat protein